MILHLLRMRGNVNGNVYNPEKCKRYSGTNGSLDTPLDLLLIMINCNMPRLNVASVYYAQEPKQLHR